MNKKIAKIENLQVIGDRVLIKPLKEENKTKSGLFLPAGYKEKEEVQSGYIVKVGPGYPIPNIGEESDEIWKRLDREQRYLSLQVQSGDLALFLREAAIEIIYGDEKYYIVSQHNILLVERDEGLV
ncbi:MAG: co-chaperone GroES family protein [Bacteroidales bacterium]|jgi:co-chaperonin GroES (HSP10)|nr:co-chaperone GroES family protein [Bacteroidales bacterium]